MTNEKTWLILYNDVILASKNVNSEKVYHFSKIK